MNKINNNSYSNNLYEKLLLNPKIKNEDIEGLLTSEDTIKSMSNKELIKLDQAQNDMVDNFLRIIKEDAKIAEQIVIKIVNGDKVTKEELDFVSKKYPEIKQIGDKALKEYNELKQALRNCNRPQERDDLIRSVLKKINTMLKKGTITELEAKVKTIAVEKLVNFNKNILNEEEKAQVISVKIVKGEKLTKEELSFISEKYPKLKQTSERLNQEIKFVKLELKELNSIERKQLISRVIKSINNILNKEESSPNEININKVAEKEVLKISKNIEKELKNTEKELKSIEKIYIKIIKGENLTAKEDDFINQKYPEIKKIAQEVAKEYINIKEELKNCKTQEQKQQVIYNIIEKKEEVIKEGTISDIYSKLKSILLDELKSDYKNKKNENNYEIKYNLNPYIYLNSKLSLSKNGGILIVIVLISTIYILGKILV